MWKAIESAPKNGDLFLGKDKSGAVNIYYWQKLNQHGYSGFAHGEWFQYWFHDGLVAWAPLPR
jgi:hypothetical protein